MTQATWIRSFASIIPAISIVINAALCIFGLVSMFIFLGEKENNPKWNQNLNQKEDKPTVAPSMTIFVAGASFAYLSLCIFIIVWAGGHKVNWKTFFKSLAPLLSIFVFLGISVFGLVSVYISVNTEDVPEWNQNLNKGGVGLSLALWIIGFVFSVISYGFYELIRAHGAGFKLFDKQRL